MLRPGGRLVVCAWLAAPAPSRWQVRHLLEPICSEGRLPSLASRAEYEAMARAAGFQVVDHDDLGARVRRTWTLCLAGFLKRLVTDRAVRRLAFARATRNRAFILSLPRLILAYRTGAMRYGIVRLRKGVSVGAVFTSPGSSASSSRSGSTSSAIGSGAPIQIRSSTWSCRGRPLLGWTRIESAPWLSISQGTRVPNRSGAKAIWNIGRACGPTGTLPPGAEPNREPLGDRLAQRPRRRRLLRPVPINMGVEARDLGDGGACSGRGLLEEGRLARRSSGAKLGRPRIAST